MTKYPLIEETGLKIHQHWESYHNGASAWPCIKADDLEKLLREATVVYGDYHNNHWSFGTHREKNCGSTHSALILNIQPLCKKVTKKEIDEMVKSLSIHYMMNGAIELLERIKKHGVADE